MTKGEFAPPARPFDVAIVGTGRVGGAFASALRRAGHRIVAELGRTDDISRVSGASLVVIAVPDDALNEVAAAVARSIRPGTAVVHTCGLEGVEPLRACGPSVAAIHPAHPIAHPDQPLDEVLFGVTCDEPMRDWCASLVADLGGTSRFIADEDRALYHAALVMASNFAVSLVADAADLLGGTDAIVPLMRATVDNVERLGPHTALTGPIVRGDVSTVRAHLRALPQHLVEVYVANGRRALALAIASGRLDAVTASAVAEALEEALVR